MDKTSFWTNKLEADKLEAINSRPQTRGAQTRAHKLEGGINSRPTSSLPTNSRPGAVQTLFKLKNIDFDHKNPF